ncbi:LOW QUALITY PROTEIN: thyroid adenoma-associated protein homolog [Motacilla alba alba]|uniref:LOW QUALITY PROTEIN: thyroid adenoma-associated protein homolog n=1 Tax=Motacilla alba alba TaxID=1094192 RepID=UPI0018D4E215|nr:LOW QUALITY PROTEIN: thyroid adenoma-associated protein homolog [Motacilla alba alba]
MGAEREARACAAFYGTRGLAPAVLSCLRCLRRFAGSTTKRCKEKHLEEALQLTRVLSEGLQALGEAEARPLLRCVLAFQMEATSSCSSFQKLEQMVTQLAVGKEALLAQEVDTLLTGLALQREVLSPEDLQSVSMFLEESSLGRQHWRQNLAPLLQRLASTLCWVLQGQPTPGSTWGYLVIKACLQVFQMLPKDVAPLVWSTSGKSETLQSLLGLLLQVAWGKALNKDTRLLAGTALSMLVNTAPQPQCGASAVLTLFQLPIRAGAGELKFGELVVEVPPVPEPDGLEKLVLTRGLLTCCKMDILCCQLEGLPHKACLLLDMVFPAVCALTREQKDCHYYCFQACSLWLQRLRESLAALWHLTGTRILAQDTELLQEVTQLLWNNAETPVEGVSEFIHSSFRLLLEIYHLECQHFQDQERPLYQQMLQRVVSMPWQIKARYVPLCAIVPYMGSQQVLDAYPDLPQHLLSCLSTNHLCPAAAEVYKVLVQQQCSEWRDGQRGTEVALAEQWALCWLPLLSQALSSPLPILQSNSANHLLTWTLRQLPATQVLLATRFGGQDTMSLRAWVSVLKAQKSVAGALPLGSEALQRLSRCLATREEGVRLAALALLCCSPNTNQPLSGTEAQLLREFLPLNLNCDSSSFRQLLQAAMRKALVRLRDSSLAQLRGKAPRCSRPAEGAEQLAQAVGFVEWLLQLSITSLRPGSNYQRKKTALLLLAAVLETCTDTWSPDRKKGQPPCTMATLLSYARQSGCWDFFSQPNLLALLSCLQDSTNEVSLVKPRGGRKDACLGLKQFSQRRSPPRFPFSHVPLFPMSSLSWQIRDLASELLVRYFPTTFPERIALAVFQLAQDTLGSPRVQEAEAGAVLMKTILQKSDSGTMKSLSLEAEAALTLPSRGLCFAQHLLRMLQAQYKVACQDLLRAAATAPMHGAVAALRRCLLQVPEVAVSMQAAELVQSWQELLTCLVTTVRDITSLLLGALQSQQGSGAAEQAAAPSFAEMGNAIGSLIMLGKGQGQEEEEGDSILLSEEHSLILTCCWVSVKEIGLLLGGLAELLLSPALPAEVGPLLPLPTLQMATRVFQEILLRCRHWGAVEGCSMGFTKFCAALLSHPDPELQAIPRAVLEQGLEALSGPRSSSITRRAAGFPMLFLCIVSGEAPAQARPLLTRCIQTLLTLAATALPQDWDQTLDLPQVCALHVLQTLVRGAGLGGAVLCHATPMMALALQGLGSPCWAMRNAAIQLFSALTSRLLGQPWSHRDGRPSEGLSLHAFLGQHPKLGAVLLGELKAATAPTSGGPRLHPALHAILTLLAQLQPAADSPGSPSAPFLGPLLGLAESPIYAVRAMAAKALVPVVAPPQRCRLLLQLARQLPAAPEQIRLHNAVHGHLLQMQALLGSAMGPGGLSAEALHPVALQLEARGWLLTPAQRCPLVRAAFLQVLALLPTSFSPGFARYIHDTISTELGSLVQGGKSGCAEPQVGSAVLHQTMAHFLCSEAARLADSEQIAAVCSLLQQPSPDIQLAILSWVIAGEGGSCKEVENALGLTLLESLQSVLQERRDKEFLRLYLEALLHLYRDPSSWSQEASSKLQGSSRSCLEMLLHMVEAECPGPDLLFQSLCAASLLLAHQCGDEDVALVERWCAALEECGQSACCEVLRLAAARSLRLAGPDVVRLSRHAARPSLVPVALRLINMAIHLLQDEEREVRHEVSGFASLLQQGPGELLQDGCIFVQDNVGLQSLLELLLGEFGEHPETFNSLLQHIPILDLRSVVEELQANKAASLYKEDEPNVFAEPAVLAQQLLPVLVQLLQKAPTGSPLHASALQWLEATGPGVLRDLQYCKRCWSQGTAVRWGMKALGCAKLHTALAVLLVRARLVAQVLQVLGEGATATPGLGYGSQELEQELELVQGLLAQQGLASVPKQDNAPGELGPLSGTDSSRHAAV